MCCLTGYYQPNRDDDVYYWQPVPSPCFIVIFFVSRKSMHGTNEVVVVFSKLIGVTFPKMIFCLMAVRNFQSYF